MTDIKNTSAGVWLAPALSPFSTTTTPSCETGDHTPETPISRLLGQVYESAPPAERSHLLASSAAAALMVGVLMQRVQAHRACEDDQGPEASPTPRA